MEINKIICHGNSNILESFKLDPCSVSEISQQKITQQLWSAIVWIDSY